MYVMISADYFKFILYMFSENLVKIGYPSLEVTKGASSETVFNVKKKTFKYVLTD